MRFTSLIAATAALTLPSGIALAQTGGTRGGTSVEAETTTAPAGRAPSGARTTAPETVPGATPQDTSPPVGSAGVRVGTRTGTGTAAGGAHAGHAQHAAVAAATQADLKAGAAVSDTHGGQVGTIESADAGGAVVATGNARAKLPLNSFGKNASGGLVVSMTKAQIEAAASTAAPASSSD
jgi:hypothetical protein